MSVTWARAVAVGTDASPGSQPESRWATEETTRLPVEVVAAYEVPVASLTPTITTATEVPPARRRCSRGWWRSSATGSGLSTSRPARVALSALAAESKNASLVVVGSRRRGGIGGLLLGSVSRGVLHRGHCAIAIARSQSRTRSTEVTE